MKRKIIVLLLTSLLILPNLAIGAAPVTVSGCSVSTLAYLNDLAKAYERETGRIILIRGGGSLLGLSELGSDKIDLAASCLSKTPQSPADFRFMPVAWDALVFIVNKANPVSNITPKDVKELYEGRITNWQQLGGRDMGIKSFISTPEGMGGIGEALSKYILNGRLPTASANSSIQSSSVSIWEQLVEKTPGGFASTGFGSARKRNVKMLAVNGVSPTKASIISGRYPYKRYLYLVMTTDASPEVRGFVDFALSKKGQRLISSYGIPALAEIK